MLTNAVAASPAHDFAVDIRRGLSKPGQKELPSKYFYDALGSKLFDVICELPEYGVTRADERLLRAHAHEIVQHLPGDVMVCELGSGSGKKTRWVLEALPRRRRTSYFPIEISGAALAECERELSDIDSIGIVGLEREYLDGLLEVAARRQDGQPILVLFLGSTIGNFSHPADQKFLREIRMILKRGDCLLLGTDLIKSLDQMIPAYADALGITAAFNLNLLLRINRELDGNFELREFEHLALFNDATQSIEMHLRSKRRQTVNIRQARFCADFEAGETIWTENSHKYSLQELSQMASAAGFCCRAQWVDEEWPFAESLLVAA